MKQKTYFIKLSIVFFLVVCYIKLNAQTIIPGGVPAKFGIDADIKSDTFAFGTSMPAPAGYDDWFKKIGGTGNGVIDTTGAYKAKNQAFRWKRYVIRYAI